MYLDTWYASWGISTCSQTPNTKYQSNCSYHHLVFFQYQSKSFAIDVSCIKIDECWSFCCVWLISALVNLVMDSYKHVFTSACRCIGYAYSFSLVLDTLTCIVPTNMQFARNKHTCTYCLSRHGCFFHFSAWNACPVHGNRCPLPIFEYSSWYYTIIINFDIKINTITQFMKLILLNIIYLINYFSTRMYMLHDLKFFFYLLCINIKCTKK